MNPPASPPNWEDLATVILLGMDAPFGDKDAYLEQANAMAKRMASKDVYRAEFAVVLHKEMKQCH